MPKRDGRAKSLGQFKQLLYYFIDDKVNPHRSFRVELWHVNLDYWPTQKTSWWCWLLRKQKIEFKKDKAITLDKWMMNLTLPEYKLLKKNLHDLQSIMGQVVFSISVHLPILMNSSICTGCRLAHISLILYVTSAIFLPFKSVLVCFRTQSHARHSQNTRDCYWNESNYYCGTCHFAGGCDAPKVLSTALRVKWMVKMCACVTVSVHTWVQLLCVGLWGLPRHSADWPCKPSPRRQTTAPPVSKQCANEFRRAMFWSDWAKQVLVESSKAV